MNKLRFKTGNYTIRIRHSNNNYDDEVKEESSKSSKSSNSKRKKIEKVKGFFKTVVGVIKTVVKIII